MQFIYYQKSKPSRYAKDVPPVHTKFEPVYATNSLYCYIIITIINMYFIIRLSSKQPTRTAPSAAHHFARLICAKNIPVNRHNT